MNNMHSSRRRFLAQTSLWATAGLSAPYFPWLRKSFANESKNDRPVIGCIGLGGEGTFDAHEHYNFGDIVAVCDVDARHAERARHDDHIGRGKSDAYKDYRRVLDRHDIDVVSIVTPDHWHVKIAVEALQAGKHVFCQKPLTLTLEENQLIRKACQKHAKQVFVVGTQQRSDHDRFLRAINMVHKGFLGDMTKVTVGINGGEVGGPFVKGTPPAELDWDFWLGQTSKVDYIPERCHFNFRWWYEYSGGKFTDWGAHHVDIATWALEQHELGQGPVEIDGTDAHHPVTLRNGYPTVDNSYNTADDFAVKCRFTTGLEMIITSRGDNGVTFEGTKGRIFVNRGKIVGRPIEEKWDDGRFTDEEVVKLYKGKPFEDHKSNFYRCVREGGQPVSDVHSHIQAMNTCHLAAIAARLGRTIRWDPKSEEIIGDDQAAKLFGRTPRPGFVIPQL